MLSPTQPQSDTKWIDITFRCIAVIFVQIAMSTMIRLGQKLSRWELLPLHPFELQINSVSIVNIFNTVRALGLARITKGALDGGFCGGDVRRFR